MDKNYWRLKKREQRAKEKGEVVVVQPIPMGRGSVEMEWDSERFPNRRAFEIALERVVRARRYAGMFPQFIRDSDLKFQDIAWQYEHEGLPASRKPESTLVVG